MKKLGVIGGLGPMATAFFMEMIIDMTEAVVDQEHVEMIIHNCPQIPDRTSYILDKSKPSPVQPMIEIGKGLVEQKAQIIAIPCITANYFWEELSDNISVPIINPIIETAHYLKGIGIKKVGIMATDGTIQSKIFEGIMVKNNIDVILPSKEKQGYVMDIIYKNVKASQKVDIDKFNEVKKELIGNGAQVIALGCTELSMVRRDYEIGAGFLDVMQLLAKKSVEECARLREEYRDIVTK